MQNMKNAVLVLTAFLFLFPYKLMAENKVISIEDGWNIEDERSISFAPQLSIDEQNIYIYSEKELNDLARGFGVELDRLPEEPSWK